MSRWPGFIGGSNTSQSLIADAEKTVNLYVEQSQSQAAKSPAGLMPSPGFSSWSRVADVGTRGSARAGERLFFVIGPSLWEFSATAVATKRGTLAQDGNPAIVVYNGVIGGQLGIASGGNIYSYNLTTNVLSAVLLTGGYTHIAFADGYGLAFNPTTGKVNLSNLNDLSTWAAGTFFQRSKFPDPWQAMWADPNGLIWLPGTETFEAWYNTGSGTQPWAPLSGLYGRFGIAAPFAYGVSGAGMYWLARSAEGGATVVTTRGSVPQPVSTYAINDAIAGYLRTSRISDAEILIYQDRGHTFVNISFASAVKTWTLDSGGGWTERGKWNSASGTYDLWAPRIHADCFGRHLVGDRTSGNIWTMSDAFATDVDGTGIRRLRRTPGFTSEGKRIPIDRLHIVMDTGTVPDQNVDPIATMRISGDGGRTWSNERQASYGKIGRYMQRVTFDRLGAPEYPVVECVWSTNAPVRVIDAFVNNMEEAA